MLNDLFGPVARNTSEQLKVGIVGTFDVENYGDLLFPLIAAAALRLREPSVQIVPFSPNIRSERAWPFRVYPTEDFPEFLPKLVAVLIGGGQLIRFDKSYPISVRSHVNLPITYWLIPAAFGALMGKPVIWNAVGVWTGSPPAPWYDDLVRTVFSASHIVGVRDVASRLHLAKIAPDADIRIIPDTAFSLSRIWPLGQESTEFKRWRNSISVEGRYVVVQAHFPIGHYRQEIDTLSQQMGEITVVVLPVCWCHGDRADGSMQFSGKVRASPEWLSPTLISEVLGRSELVIASGLHACIAALSYGVPVVRVPGSNASDRKFELLDELEGIAMIHDLAACTTLVHRGRIVERGVVERINRLETYWDRVIDVVLHPENHNSNRSTGVMMGSFSTIIKNIEGVTVEPESIP